MGLEEDALALDREAAHLRHEHKLQAEKERRTAQENREAMLNGEGLDSEDLQREADRLRIKAVAGEPEW